MGGHRYAPLRYQPLLVSSAKAESSSSVKGFFPFSLQSRPSRSLVLHSKMSYHGYFTKTSEGDKGPVGYRAFGASSRSFKITEMEVGLYSRSPTSWDEDSQGRAEVCTGCDMKALSIRQPWAWLIIAGHKDIENRSWDTKYRGPVLVHAGRAWARMSIDEIEKHYRLKIPRPNLMRGGIIGVVDLVDIVTKHRSRWFDGDGFGWVLKNPRSLQFRKIDGRLGLFEV